MYLRTLLESVGLLRPKHENPYLLNEFIQWLGKQAPERSYEWMWPSTCPVGVFAKSIGRTYHELKHLDIEEITKGTEDHTWTYGACLERAIAWRKRNVR